MSAVYSLKLVFDNTSFESGSISLKSGQNILKKNACRTKVFYHDLSFKPGGIYHVCIKDRKIGNFNCPMVFHFYDSNHNYIGEKECIYLPNDIKTNVSIKWSNDGLNSNGEEGSTTEGEGENKEDIDETYTVDTNNPNQEDFLFQFPEHASYLRIVLDSSTLKETLTEDILYYFSTISILFERSDFFIMERESGQYLDVSGDQLKRKYLPYEKLDLSGIVVKGLFGVKEETPEKQRFELQIINNFSVRNFDTLTLTDPKKSSKYYYIQWNGYECEVSYDVKNRYEDSSKKVSLMNSLHQNLLDAPKTANLKGDEDVSEIAVATYDPDVELIYDENYTFYEILKNEKGKDYNPPRARITHIGINALDKSKTGDTYSYTIPIYVEVDEKKYYITSIGSNACDPKEDITRGVISGIRIISPPKKLEYLLGEPLSLDGCQVVLMYKKTSEEDPLSLDNLSVSGFENTYVNPELPIVLTYTIGGNIFSDSFNISMKQKTANVVLTSLKWGSGPNQKRFVWRSKYNWEGLTLITTYFDSDTKKYEDVNVPYTSADVKIQTSSGINTIGDKTVTVTYTIPENVSVNFDNTTIQDGQYVDIDDSNFSYTYSKSNEREHVFTFTVEVVKEADEDSILTRRVSSIRTDPSNHGIGDSIRGVINTLIVQKDPSVRVGMTFEDGCFKNCTSLTTLSVDGLVLSYESNSFYNTGIRMLTIRSDTQSVLSESFRNCSNLGAIIIHDRDDPILFGEKCFYGIKEGATIMVATEQRKMDLMNNYGDSPYFETRKVSLDVGTVVDLNDKMDDGLGSIYQKVKIGSQEGYEIYKSTTTVQRAVVPERVIVDGEIHPVISIGQNAYADRENLSVVSISSKNITIGNYAFQNCIRLSKFEIQTTVKNITYGIGVFRGCLLLDIHKLVNTMTEFPDEIFMDCHNTSTMNFSMRLTSIGKKSFYNNEMSSLLIPQSVTSIGDEAFSNCTQLKEVFMNPLECSIGKDVFSNCGGPITFYVPNETMNNAWSSATNKKVDLDIVSAVDVLVWEYGSTAEGKKTYVDAHNVLYTLYNDNGQYTAVMEDATDMKSSIIENGIFTVPSYVFTVDTTSGGATTQYQVQSIAPRCFQGLRKMIRNPETKEDVPVFSHFINSPYVEHIPEHCFDGSTLKSIDFRKATSIGDYAFSDTEISDEKDVVLPINAFYIQDGSYHGPVGIFRNCKFTKIEHLFDGISYIPDGTFEGCRSLKTIILNHEVVLGIPGKKDTSGKLINCTIFKGCSSVENLYILAPIQWQKGIFLHGTLKDTTKNSKGWNNYNGTRIHVADYNNYIHLKEDTSPYYHLNPMVAGYTTSELPSPESSKSSMVLSKIVAESDIKHQNVSVDVEWGIYGGTGFVIRMPMTSVVWVPSHILSEYSHQGSTYYRVLENTCPDLYNSGALTEIHLPYTLPHPGYFSYCTNLKYITFPKYMKSISDEAFHSCYSLIPMNQRINTLPSTLESIGTKAFFGAFQHGTGEVFEAPERTTKFGDAVFCVSCIHEAKFYVKDQSSFEIGHNTFDDCSGHVGYKFVAYMDKYFYQQIYRFWRDAFKTPHEFYGPNDLISNWIRREDLTGTYPDTVQEDLSKETYSAILTSKPAIYQGVDEKGILRTTSSSLTSSMLRGKTDLDLLILPGRIHKIESGFFSGVSISKLIINEDIQFETGSLLNMTSAPKEIFFLGTVTFDIEEWDMVFKDNDTRFYVSSPSVYQSLLGQCPYLLHRLFFIHRTYKDVNEVLVQDWDGLIYKKIGNDAVEIVWLKMDPDSERTSYDIPSYLLEGNELYRVQFIASEILTGYKDIHTLFVDTSQIIEPEVYHRTEIIVSDASLSRSRKSINVLVIPYQEEEEHLYTDLYSVYRVDQEKEVAYHVLNFDPVPEQYTYPNKIVISLEPYIAYTVKYSEDENE